MGGCFNDLMGSCWSFFFKVPVWSCRWTTPKTMTLHASHTHIPLKKNIHLNVTLMSRCCVVAGLCLCLCLCLCVAMSVSTGPEEWDSSFCLLVPWREGGRDRDREINDAGNCCFSVLQCCVYRALSTPRRTT